MGDLAHLIQAIQCVNPNAFPTSRGKKTKSKARKSNGYVYTPNRTARKNARLASEVAHAPRSVYTQPKPRKRLSEQRQDTGDPKRPTTDAVDEKDAERIETLRSLQEKVLLLEDEGQKKKIQEFIDSLQPLRNKAPPEPKTPLAEGAFSLRCDKRLARNNKNRANRQTAVPKDLASVIEFLKPILLMGNNDDFDKDPRWEMLLNRMLLCIMETRELQQRISDGKSVLDSLDQQERDFRGALEQLNGKGGTDNGPGSHCLDLVTVTSQQSATSPNIVSVAADMHNALVAVAAGLKTPVEVAAEARRKKHLEHLLRSAHKKFGKFDKDQDGYIDAIEMRAVAQWLWAGLHVHGEQLPVTKQAQMVQQVMRAIDVDEDGYISEREFEALFVEAAKKISKLHRQLHMGRAALVATQSRCRVESPVVARQRYLMKEMVEGARRVFRTMDTHSRQDVKNEELKLQRLRELNKRLTVLLDSARRMAQLVAEASTGQHSLRQWCAHMHELIVAARAPQALFMVISVPQPNDGSGNGIGGAPSSPRSRDFTTRSRKIMGELRSSQNESAQAEKTVAQLELELRRREGEAMEIMHTLVQMHAHTAEDQAPLLMWDAMEAQDADAKDADADAAELRGGSDGVEAKAEAKMERIFRIEAEAELEAEAEDAEAVIGNADVDVDQECEDLKKWMANLKC